MRKLSKGLLLLSPLTCLIATAYTSHGAIASTPNNLKIGRLYLTRGEKSSNSNYVILQNGLVVFYSPAIRERLVNLSLDAQEPFKTITMTLDPKTKTQKWR